MQLHPYQARAVEELRTLVSAGHRRVLVSCPTGGGKTVFACAIIHSARTNFDAKILFCVHRKELVDQAVRQLARWGIASGVIRADDERTDPSHPVQIATVQSLSRRAKPPADIVFVDEAHRAPGESYEKLLTLYPEATIIGLTATPCRLDGKPLGACFDALLQVASYSELIASGDIVSPIVYAARVTPDVSRVHKRAGDFSEDELERACLEPHVIGNVVEEWKAKAGGRATVVFAASVEHSKELQAAFVMVGVPCWHIDASTPETTRELALEQLRVGIVPVLCNVGILCEGWDQPSAKCCVMARPTLSLSLYMQCVGRILRPYEGIVPLVLDHAGNTDRHGLPHEDRDWSLTEGVVRRRPKTPYRLCPGCYAYVERNPCELCGHHRAPEPRERREVAGEMVVATGDVTPERAFFEAKASEARSKGFKPGYAAAKYKEKFGAWPAWSWSDALKREFALDTAWQERQARREREREWWLEHQPARMPAMAAAGVEMALEEQEGPQGDLFS